MSARDEVLRRVRNAIGDPASTPGIPREYRIRGEELPGSPALVKLLANRLRDYGASVTRARPSGLPAALGELLRESVTVVIPPGLPPVWRKAIGTAERELIVDGEPRRLDTGDLDMASSVVTGCRLAIAETGTIVLDAGPQQGRRALTLLPDQHVVVVYSEHVVGTVPEALQRLDPYRSTTFISGPSATSDIEFRRVEGVHGPRRLDVIVVDE
jgi:L-lactate dehydrogenase complex protein LldG